MRSPIYRYNAETCRYERNRRSWFGVAAYIVGLVLCSMLMLVGILLLHDFLIDSKKEIALRSENRSLRQNHRVVLEELLPVEAKLVSLNQKDEQLHTKFFGEQDNRKKEEGNDHAEMLLFSPDDSDAFLLALKRKSQDVLTAARSDAGRHNELISFTRNTFHKIKSLPLTIPLKSFDASMLLSGFGMRVNPFHKGLYDHPGVDLAVVRGSEVIAPADGTVALVKRSDLQAGYGNYMEVDHGNGIITRYAHLEDILVRTGQKISKGTTIGLTGNSGGSIAPHLHYEVIRDGKNVNPVEYFTIGMDARLFEDLTNLSSIQNQSLD